MKAKTVYNDLRGTASADITDFGTDHNSLEDLAKKFKLDTSKLELIGLKFYGIEDIQVQLICIDLTRSNKDNKHIVTLGLPEGINASLPRFFKRLEVVLLNAYDKENVSLEINGEKNWDDYMEEE